MNEKKLEKLEMPEVEVIRFEKDDVIATSNQIIGPIGGEPGTETEIP